MIFSNPANVQVPRLLHGAKYCPKVQSLSTCRAHERYRQTTIEINTVETFTSRFFLRIRPKSWCDGSAHNLHIRLILKRLQKGVNLAWVSVVDSLLWFCFMCYIHILFADFWILWSSNCTNTLRYDINSLVINSKSLLDCTLLSSMYCYLSNIFVLTLRVIKQC